MLSVNTKKYSFILNKKISNLKISIDFIINNTLKHKDVILKEPDINEIVAAVIPLYNTKNKILAPNIKSTLTYLIKFKKIDPLSWGRSIAAIYDYEIDGNISPNEVFIDKDNFPMYGDVILNINIRPVEEKVYNFKIKLKTTSRQIPIIEIPITFVSTKLNVDNLFKFDENDFFV